jgi:hypothetical protein
MIAARTPRVSYDQTISHSSWTCTPVFDRLYRFNSGLG